MSDMLGHKGQRTRIVAKPLMAYIAYEDRRKAIVKSLAEVNSMKQLCCNVLLDVYNTELSGYENRSAIVVNASFVQSLLPYLTNYTCVHNIESIRQGIYKYVINKGNGGKTQGH